MKKLAKRISIGLVIVLVLGTSAFAALVAARQNRKFDAPYPDIKASSDPAVIARGRYLALGPAHCIGCHASNQDPEPALAGGIAFHLPVGPFDARNVTPAPKPGNRHLTHRFLLQAEYRQYVVFTSRDVTSRVATEDALVASQARSQALIEAMPDLIFLVGRDGLHLEVHAHSESSLRPHPRPSARIVVEGLSESMRELAQHAVKSRPQTGELAPAQPDGGQPNASRPSAPRLDASATAPRNAKAA